MDCLFCKIIAGEIPSAKVYEDEHCYAFKDVSPQTPSHVLIVPKKHVSGLNDTELLPDDSLAACVRAAAKVAKQEGLTQGYRLVSNCGPHACQSVQHLHFHELGGRQMEGKMG